MNTAHIELYISVYLYIIDLSEVIMTTIFFVSLLFISRIGVVMVGVLA